MNDPNFPANVPSFKLGRYLVTTARFKVWLEEGGGLVSKAPAVGAGKHPTLDNTGWREEYNAGLSETVELLKLKVYTDPSSTGWGCTLDYYPQSPRLPVNCIDWYLMQAFCAWDGGYAITEAQWEAATRGGEEQRKYAWGNDEPTSLDTSVMCVDGVAIWPDPSGCNSPTTPIPKDVGFSANGAGRWGTHDLQGNLVNMVLDETTANGGTPMAMPCENDCVSKPETDPGRSIARGTCFAFPQVWADPPRLAG
ncbi:MAG TPA: SUMF1/EgtB/PvdO family nonheme iron enzyme, partial [Acidimicrobiia bacterium]|nr:SUMF1/EgtB/PvdO family nonheme iron enzyme [Acidimicrobiia bacterium]